MSYSSLKHLAHGLALQVLQRWSGVWLLVVEAEVDMVQAALVGLELEPDYLFLLARLTRLLLAQVAQVRL